MTRCPPDCRPPTAAMAHCATCHRTFGGVGGFDRHRRGGQCLDPADLDMREVDGVWRGAPMGEGTRRYLRDVFTASPEGATA